MVFLYALGIVYLIGCVATFVVSLSLGADCLGALDASWRWPYFVATAKS